MSSGETFSSSLGIGGLNSLPTHPACEIEFTNVALEHWNKQKNKLKITISKVQELHSTEGSG